MSDLIERLKVLHGDLQKGFVNYDDDADLVSEAITALEAMPVWVRCSERMPEEDGAYMSFDGEDVGECLYTKAKGFRWQTGWAASIEQWSEMPAPPKVEQEA